MVTLPFSNRINSSRLLIFLLAVGLAFSCVCILGNRDRQTYLLFKVVSQQQAPLQVFFDTGEGVGTKFNQLRIIPAGTLTHSVRFPVPVDSIHGLRIDPAPGMDLTIIAISLVDRHNALIVDLDIKNLRALHDIKEIRETSEGILVTAQGEDPQLKMVFSKPLPQTYGFNKLFALVMFCILYFLLWGVFCLVDVISKKSFSRSGIQVSQKNNTFFYNLHRGIIFAGILSLAGAVVLWMYEQQRPLGEDHGKHELTVYQSSIVPQPVTFKREKDGLLLAGLLYRPQESADKKISSILLLHGNYAQGSAYPLYQVLASELARKGYRVLAMDFAGWGKSADPFRSAEVENIHLDDDAAAGVAFLRKHPPERTGYLHVLGHSMGGDPAISVGSTSDDVRSIALIGPPRRVHKRFNYPPDVNFFWNWAHHVRKSVYGIEHFPDWYTKDRWRQQILDRDMVQFLPYFSQWSHKPVLFMDGERELGPDKRFLQWYFCRTSWPKQYITLNEATHDCNVVKRKGNILYDRAVMEQTITALDAWFRRAEKRQSRLFDSLLNLLRRLFAVEMLTEC